MYVYEVQNGKTTTTTTTTKTLQRQPFESVCYRQKHSYEFLNKQTLDKENAIIITSTSWSPENNDIKDLKITLQ